MGDEQKQEQQEAGQGTPDGPKVQPVEGEELKEGTYAGGEQNTISATAVGHDPGQPRATSAPPPEWQSGEAELKDEGVQAKPHAEQSITDPGTPDASDEVSGAEGDVESRQAEQEQPVEQEQPQPEPEEESKSRRRRR